MTGGPGSPIAAATHANPYTYYEELARERPFYRDEALGLWIASSAEAVTAVLTNPLCRVRAPSEPVPKALLGSSAGDVFRHLMRMNDGEGHCAPKRAASSALASLNLLQVERESRRWARLLFEPLTADPRPGLLTRFQFDLPVYVVGTLIGLPEDALPRLAPLVGRFVQCLAPASSSEEIESGNVAAVDLLKLFRSVLADGGDVSGNTPLSIFARASERFGYVKLDSVAANGIGFLSQTYEATAGLIGNTLLAIMRNPVLRETIRDEPNSLHGIVQEVVRLDPSIQNTRRWIAGPGIVAGQNMTAGDAILVLLAAANRDPSANPNPSLFDASRQSRRSFTFGVGNHECPGEMLATTIAVAAVEQVLTSHFSFDSFAGPVSYRPSANARIPLL